MTQTLESRTGLDDADGADPLAEEQPAATEAPAVADEQPAGTEDEGPAEDEPAEPAATFEGYEG